VQNDLAAAHGLESGDATQYGGFAAAARTEEAADASGLELEREILENRALIVRVTYAADLQ
jgi:hypothetical protein